MVQNRLSIRAMRSRRIAYSLFTGALSLLFCALSSCSLFSDDASSSAAPSSPETPQYATISLSASVQSARTVLPSVLSISVFSDFAFTYTPTGGTATALTDSSEKSTFSSLADLNTALSSLSFLAAEYTFSLTAELNDATYTGSTTQTLSYGSNSISIELSLNGTGYGGFSLTVTITDASDVTLVKASLQNTAGTTVLAEEELSVSSSTCTYAKTLTQMTSASLASGTYRIVIAFYGGTDSNLLLNTYKELVRIAPGVTSSASRTLDLNEVYTITWYNNDGTLASSSDSQPTQYSRKSDTITLPTLTKSGYLFIGWYTDSAFATSAGTALAAGSTGDKTFYAKFVSTTLYVSSDSSASDDNNGLSSDKALATLEKAVGASGLINTYATDYGNSNGDWIVYVSGSFNNTALTIGTLSAASLTIQALTDSSSDVLSGSSSASVLTLTNTIPVTIKDLTIMNGKCGITASGSRSVTVSGSAIANCSGSGISVTGTGAVTVETSLISGNSAENGGGIYAESGTTVTVTDSTIKTNTASSAGGGIYSAGTLTIDAATVGNKDATDVASSSGYANKAGSQGGGIYSSGTVVIKSGSYVTYNYVSDSSSGTTGGGGILIEGGNLTIEDGATISYNSASCRGGGIDVINGTSGATVTMNGGTITYNAAGYFGGGVMFGETESSTAITTFTMKSGTISYNSATGSTDWAEYGGGVYVVHGTFDMQGGEISHNETTNGGAGVFVGTADNASLFTMSGGTISDNSAGTVGGGVCNNSIFTMTGGTISGNTATSTGGGVHNEGSFYMSGSAVIGDSSKTSTATSSSGGYSNYAGTHGGGIYNIGSAYLGYTDASTTADFTGGIYYNYGANNGGGVYTEGALLMNGGTIGYNLTYQTGGGLRLAGTDTVTVSGGTIKGNKTTWNSSTAVYGGGGIYVGSGSTLNLTGGTVLENTSTLVGGGILNSGGTVSVSGNTEISSNTASTNGGGIHIASGTVTLSNGSVNGNGATNGGGVSVASGATFKMSGGIIGGTEVLYANNASAYGGGVYNEGTVYISGSGVIGRSGVTSVADDDDYANSASYNGGGFFNDGGTLYIGYSDESTVDEDCTGGIFYNKDCGLYNTNGTMYMASGDIAYNTYGYGGGVYLSGGSGVFSMSGGRIYGNAAPSSSAGNGGAIQISSGKFNMSGGTIFSNSATLKGSGVYVGVAGTFTMSESAVISSDNDVYLYGYSGHYNSIKIADTLTGTTPVATITPVSYDAGLQLLADGDTSGMVAANYAKFAVTSDGSNLWCVDSSGLLAYATGDVSLTISSTDTLASTLAAIKSSSASVSLDLSGLDVEDLSTITDVQNNLMSNTHIVSIILPNTLTTITASLFQGCTALKSVVIPENVTIIKSGAFQNCDALTAVSLPASLITIETQAFQGCTSLTSITIPAAVTSIGAATFLGTSITSAVFETTTGWTKSDDGTSVPVSATDYSTNAEYLTDSSSLYYGAWTRG